MTYKTRLDWNGKEWMVYFSRDVTVGQGEHMLAIMSLDDWAKLSATEYLLGEAVRVLSEAVRPTAPTP